MKSIVKMSMAAGLLSTAIIGFVSCESNVSEATPVAYTEILSVIPDGTSSILESELESVLYDIPVTEGTDEELLLHMVEEEKLARDVYNALYVKWNIQIFSNIASAEQKHMDAVLYLIQNYSSLEVTIGEPGAYLNEDFTLLYQQLVEKGSVSITDALTVGALIEELDIYDLAQYISQTTNENILIVFDNLMKGSRNHLRAFNRQLVNLGVVYIPQFIDQITFDEIVTSAFETGKKYAKHNGGSNGNGNGSGNGSGNGNGTHQGTGDCQL